MKFTPGPWRADKDNLNVYANGMVAQTFGHIHDGEREANAKLIAAAPEMFAFIHRFGKTGQRFIDDFAEAQRILKKIDGDKE